MQVAPSQQPLAQLVELQGALHAWIEQDCPVGQARQELPPVPQTRSVFPGWQAKAESRQPLLQTVAAQEVPASFD